MVAEDADGAGACEGSEEEPWLSPPAPGVQPLGQFVAEGCCTVRVLPQKVGCYRMHLRLGVRPLHCSPVILNILSGATHAPSCLLRCHPLSTEAWELLASAFDAEATGRGGEFGPRRGPAVTAGAALQGIVLGPAEEEEPTDWNSLYPTSLCAGEAGSAAAAGKVGSAAAAGQARAVAGAPGEVWLYALDKYGSRREVCTAVASPDQFLATSALP